MKKFLILFLTTLIIVSCKNQKSNSVQKNTDTETLSKNQDCIPYFDFDKVEYYHIDISNERFLEIAKSKNDSLLFSIINRRTFSKITDTILIGKLPELGFSEMKILEKDNHKLNQLFCIEDSGEVTMNATACDPIYKDILIFLKSNKTIGIAKICFSCSQSLIINQKNQILPFYSDENWKELNSLLKKYQ